MHWVTLGILNYHRLATDWTHSPLGRDGSTTRRRGGGGILRGRGGLGHLNCTVSYVLLGSGRVTLQNLTPCRLYHQGWAW